MEGPVQPGCMIPEKQTCSLRDEPGCAEEADPASPPSPTGRLAQEAGTVGATVDLSPSGCQLPVGLAGSGKWGVCKGAMRQTFTSQPPHRPAEIVQVTAGPLRDYVSGTQTGGAVKAQGHRGAGSLESGAPPPAPTCQATPLITCVNREPLFPTADLSPSSWGALMRL